MVGGSPKLLFFFFFFLGGGGGGVGGGLWYSLGGFRYTSGLLPDNTGSPWEISNFGGGDKPLLLFSIAIMWLSSFDVDIYNFMIDKFKVNSASCRTGTFL